MAPVHGADLGGASIGRRPVYVEDEGSLARSPSQVQRGPQMVPQIVSHGNDAETPKKLNELEDELGRLVTDIRSISAIARTRPLPAVDLHATVSTLSATQQVRRGSKRKGKAKAQLPPPPPGVPVPERETAPSSVASEVGEGANRGMDFTNI